MLNPFDFNTTSVSDQNTRSGVKALIFPQSGTGTPSGTFNPGTTITQATTNAKGFVVSYDSTTKVLKYYQDSVDGVTSGNIIAFSGNNQITSSDLVTATPDSTFGTASVPVAKSLLAFRYTNWVCLSSQDMLTEKFKSTLEKSST